jgi:site-specific DNA recombinase
VSGVKWYLEMAITTRTKKPRGVRRGQRAVIYARISKDQNHDELGVDRQERECRELCEHLGLEVIEVFRDDDRSAYSGKPRKRYLEMMRRLGQHEFEVIVAWDPDRLHRARLTELEPFIDAVNEAGVQIVTVAGGAYDLTTSAGRLQARVVGSVARHESEHKAERINSKMVELAGQRRMTGGTGRYRAFGYHPYVPESHRLEVREDEADVIRDLASRFLAGESLVSLARLLNKQQVPSVGGGEWRATSVRTILGSPRIAGLREVDGALVPAAWDAIIEPQQYRQVRALLDERAEAVKERRARRAPRRYLLSGVLTCGSCGHAMYGHPRGGRKPPIYVCVTGPTGGCGRVSALLEEVDELVVARVLDLVDGPGFAALLDRATGAEPDPQDAERRAIEARGLELSEMHAAGEITRAEHLAGKAVLSEQLKALGRKEAKTGRQTALDRWRAHSLREAWPTLDLSQQQAIVSSLLKITIQPAARHGLHRFDDTRVLSERRI